MKITIKGIDKELMELTKDWLGQIAELETNPERAAVALSHVRTSQAIFEFFRALHKAQVASMTSEERIAYAKLVSGDISGE